MSHTLIATIAGLVTAFCWGTGDWLSAKSTKRLSPIEINFGANIAGIVLVSLLLFFPDLHVPSHSQLLTIAEGSALITAAYLVFVKALSSGIVGIIVPIGNSYPLITVSLSVVFLSQVFILRQVGAMIAIVLGAALLAYQKNRNKISFRDQHKETLLAVCAALIWGVAFFVFNPLVSKVSWQVLTITVEIFMFCFGCLLLLITHQSKTLSAAKRSLAYKPALLIGILGTFGGMIFYLGSHYAGSIIIPTVLSAAGPLVASVLGAVFDKEKIGTLKRTGAVLIVAGIIILNVA